MLTIWAHHYDVCRLSESYLRLSQPISAYLSLSQPILAYLSRSQPIRPTSAYLSLSWPIPVYSSHISVYFRIKTFIKMAVYEPLPLKHDDLNSVFIFLHCL